MKTKTMKITGIILALVMIVSALGAFSLTANAVDTTYAVAIDSNITHGTVTASPTTAAEGEVVILTVTPESGYSLATSTLTVSDGTNEIETTAVADNTFAFIMPAGNVTVTARFGIPTGEVYYVNDEENGTTFIFGNGTVSNVSTDIYSNVVLEEGVTAIGDYAFRGISLLGTLTIKGDLTAIGRNAFQGCSSLETIYYYGTTVPSSTGNNLSGIKLYSPNGISILGLEPVNAYTVTIDSAIENGTVTVPQSLAAAGDTVKVSVIPAEGYKLDVLTVSDGTNSIPTTAGHVTLYTFTMPASNVTVKATFKPADPCTTVEGCTGGYLNGFCSVCGGYQSALYNAQGHSYSVSNAGQLYWIAEQINAGASIQAVSLTADIVVNENVLTEEGELNGDGSNLRPWIPIASYSGGFYGNKHTVSGLYVNVSDDGAAGMFGTLNAGGLIYDMGLVDSYIKGRDGTVGGLVAFLAYGSIEICYSESTVIGGRIVGGVVGETDYGTVKNCYNKGFVRAVTLSSDSIQSMGLGGVVGYSSNGTLETCSNRGIVASTGFFNGVGGVVGILDEGGVVSECTNSNTVSATNELTPVGGVVGHNQGSTVQRSINEINGIVTGISNVGGVVGSNVGLVNCCVNKGFVSGTGDKIGGVVGYVADGTVQQNYHIGSVIREGSHDFVKLGAVAGYVADGSLKNNYYLTNTASGGIEGEDVNGQAEEKTAEQFSSGEVAYLLGKGWGQVIGNDDYPVFANGSNTVYLIAYCDGTPISYSNTENTDLTHKGLNDYGYCELCQIKITGASISAGTDLTMRYAVDLLDETLVGEGQALAMIFTMNGKTVTVYANEERLNSAYVFEFRHIAPQCMADLIDAFVVIVDENGEVVDTLTEKMGYSVKANAEALLEQYSSDRALVQLVTDMLTYGAAAQNYRDYNTENLASAEVEMLGTPSEALPGKSDMSITESTSETVRFKSATVWFDNVNMLGIGISTIENVTLKVNGVEVELTDTTCLTEPIYATLFDKIYTFELYEGDTLVQTLEYNVSSYVYAVMNRTESDGETLTEMAELARALYRYGASATAYKFPDLKVTHKGRF